MPGIVDPSSSTAQQAAQMAAQLEREGLSSEAASRLANITIGPLGAPTGQVFVVIGTALPRDLDGNLYELSSSGNVVVHRSGGRGQLVLDRNESSAWLAAVGADLAPTRVRHFSADFDRFGSIGS
jgi:hypothetical protein